MGKPIRTRTGGYASDITTLAHIAAAVKMDKRIPPRRVEELVKHLDAATIKLIECDRGLGLHKSGKEKEPAA
jgi:hypothetical protein